MCPSCIYYRLKSEVSITLRCQLCMFNPLHNSTNQELFEKFAIKVATMKNTDVAVTKGSHHVLPLIWHFSLSAKMNGTQGRTLKVHEECIVHTVVCQRHLAMSNSEKTKPVALAVVKLCACLKAYVSYSVSQLLSQSVTQSVSYSVSQLLSQSVTQSVSYSVSQSVENSVK